MENQLNSTSNNYSSRNRPKCARCQNHGVKIDLRGHKRYCKYQQCNCVKCDMTVKRQKIMAQQTSFRRATFSDETRMLCEGEVLPVSFNAQNLREHNLRHESYNVCQGDSQVHRQLQQSNFQENFYQTSFVEEPKPIARSHGQFENYDYHSNGKGHFLFSFL